MIRIISFLCVFLFCVTSFANPSKKVVQEMKKSVMVYVTKSAYSKDRARSATAFPISKNMLMTAGHFCDAVMKGAKENKNDIDIYIKYINQNDEVATLHGGKISRYELTDSSDICLIQFPKHGIKPVKFAKNDDIKFGDKVYTCGAPHGDFPAITEGYIGQSYTEEMSESILNDKIFVSIPIIYGNSGGPLLNERGEVIGIVVMVDTSYHHSVYAVPLRKIVLFMIGL